MIITNEDHYRPPHADHLGGLVLSVTLSLELLGSSTKADREMARGRVEELCADQTFVGIIFFGVAVEEIPTSGGRLVWPPPFGSPCPAT